MVETVIVRFRVGRSSLKTPALRLRPNGFTFIELIGVMVLLGVLSAYAVIKYTAIMEDAGKAAARGGVSAAQSALAIKYSQEILANPAAATTFSCDGLGSEVATVDLLVTIVDQDVDTCRIVVIHMPTSQIETSLWTKP